jgi:pyrroline-5-carboxylate reductase
MSDITDTRIAFVGGGAMAEAFIGGLLAKGLAAPQRIVASDPVPDRRQHLAGSLGIRTIASNREAVEGAGIVVLAVKPQVVGRVLEDLAPAALAADALLITFIAGVRIATLRAALGERPVVRLMPNTPAQIGEGISAWTATPDCTEAQRAQARAMIGALGEEVYVEEEGYLDMATALSGSGPGYVFLFIEALIDAGVRIGLARAVAEKLVLQTVRGSALYAQRSGQHPAALRNAVTSPGGTTAEGLHQLERGGLRAAIEDAVAAAYQRARQLGGPEHG